MHLDAYVLRKVAPALFLLLLFGMASSPPSRANEATFCISGNSDGVAWSWGIVGTNSTCKELNVGPLAAGAGPTAFRDRFIESINNNAACAGATFHAIPHPDPACFTILKGQPIDFYVGAAGTDPTTNGCLVTPGGCSFNPIIAKIGPISTERSGWGRIKSRYR